MRDPADRMLLSGSVNVGQNSGRETVKRRPVESAPSRGERIRSKHVESNRVRTDLWNGTAAVRRIQQRCSMSDYLPPDDDDNDDDDDDDEEDNDNDVDDVDPRRL